MHVYRGWLVSNFTLYIYIYIGGYFNGVVWSTLLNLPERCDICMHWHSTSAIRRRIRRWQSTYRHMAQWEGCELTSLVVYIKNIFYDIRKINVTLRSQIWTTNIRSLGFWDIRERVTLWGLILRSLGCIYRERLEGIAMCHGYCMGLWPTYSCMEIAFRQSKCWTTLASVVLVDARLESENAFPPQRAF